MNEVSPASPATQVKYRSRPLLVVLSTIGVLALILIGLFVGGTIYLTSKASEVLENLGASGSSHFTTMAVEGTNNQKFGIPSGGESYVAGIQLNSPITSGVADVVISKLKAAADDSQAVGILFEVSSPGGTVTASQEIFDAVGSAAAKKPVVVYVRDMAASGAYYSSASASYIVANRTSLVGSIGVILHSVDASELVKFLKLNPTTIKTGALKDAGSPLKPMTPEEQRYLEDLVGALRLEFVADIERARKLPPSTLNAMADGRVVVASTALNLRLIDAVGSKDDAMAEIAKRSSNEGKKLPLIYYEDVVDFSHIFADQLANSGAQMIRQGLVETAQSLGGSL
jgi:protease-4